MSSYYRAKQIRTKTGFTLIEMMIVVAIIGLLGAIAYPTYQNSVRKSHRGSAQAFMMDVAQREQQLFLDRRRYVAVANNAGFQTALNMAVPDEVSPHYDLTVTLVAGPPASFLITSTPKGSQTADGNLTLDGNGNKTHHGNSGW